MSLTNPNNLFRQLLAPALLLYDQCHCLLGLPWPCVGSDLLPPWQRDPASALSYSQATFERGSLALGCRGHPLRRDQEGPWLGFLPLSLEGCVACSTLTAEGRINTLFNESKHEVSLPCIRTFGQYPPRQEPCFPTKAKSRETWTSPGPLFSEAMSKQARVNVCGGGGRARGRDLYFPFPFMCIEQGNEGMWWPICDCDGKCLLKIIIHDLSKRAEGMPLRLPAPCISSLGRGLPTGWAFHPESPPSVLHCPSVIGCCLFLSILSAGDTSVTLKAKSWDQCGCLGVCTFF